MDVNERNSTGALMTTSLLDWALYYQKIGLSIIPVKEKIPLIAWKEFQTRKANEEEIRNWWKQFPEADIGMVTGSITNRLVLDIDGESAYRDVEKLGIPITAQVRTKRGVQFHFQFPGVLSEQKTTLAGLLPSVDVRGEGGYTKLPPSSFSDKSGRYEWVNQDKVADCPDWLIKLLNKPKEENFQSKESDWIAETLNNLKDGTKHDDLVAILGRLRHDNYTPQTAFAFISPYFKDMGVSDEDIWERIDSVWGLYPSKEEKPVESRSLALLDSGTLVKNYSRPPSYLVPGLIPKATRTIFSGWQGRGKSFSTTDLVIEISRKKGDGKWLGEFPVSKGPVIYVDNENGKNLVSYRLDQLLKPKGIRATDLDLHWVLEQHFKMTTPKDYQWLMEQVETIKPVLVVIDSLASAHNMDEDASKDMRILFDDMFAPFCEKYNCGILVIDHENKGTPGVALSAGKRRRGSGAKTDAADQGIALNEKDGIVFIEQDKARYARRHAPFAIEIDSSPGYGASVKFKGYLNV